jgi:hypothetical protein
VTCVVPTTQEKEEAMSRFRKLSQNIRNTLKKRGLSLFFTSETNLMMFHQPIKIESLAISRHAKMYKE